MRDFYRRPKIPENAGRKEIKLALIEHPDKELRSAGATILLDERRKSVYDRDRQVLATIGQLRSRLGLYLAPFWARGQYADFSYGDPPPTNSQKINQLIVSQAFKPGGRRRSHRGRYREVIAAVIGGVIALAFLVALIYLATHDLPGQPAIPRQN